MRPTAISLSPNTEKDDVWCAFKQLLSPWDWYSRLPVENLEKLFRDYFGKNYYFKGVNSGRSALYIILKSLGIKKGDEVLVQAFTCVAVPNSVHWTGATPVFIDIDETLNISVADVKEKLTTRTKAIVVQHTFGIPGAVEELRKICDKHGIILIEDCAHALGAEYKRKKLGTFGDVAFFSFGRDKVISSVFGGMVMTNNNSLFEKIDSQVESLGMNSYGWIFQQLIHPLLFNILILPFYNLGIGKVSLGKVLLFSFQKLRILSRPVYVEELSAKKPNDFPKKLSGAIATLAISQFAKLDRFNARRKEIAQRYSKGLRIPNSLEAKVHSGAIWLRYPILVSNPSKLFKDAKSSSVLLGKWYCNVVDPKCDLRKVGYKSGSTSYAEKVAKKILNLPTYPLLSDQEVDNVIKIINEYNG